MKHHTHLIQNQRYQISALKQAKTPISEIARIIGCHKPTITRELKRNKGLKSYRPKQVHRLACKRRVVNSPTISKFGWAYVEHLLSLKYSPEQITGRLRYLGWENVPCHETIYQYIYTNKQLGDELHKHLRCQKTEPPPVCRRLTYLRE